LLDRARSATAIQRAVRAALGLDHVDDRRCAELALLTTDVVVRDHAWAMMTRPDAEDHVRLWGRVVARVPPQVSAGPLGLLGMAGWISGNGALQNCCAERLDELFPDYNLGRILAELSERAIPPSYWEEWSSFLRTDLDLI
jgi:hypothetical protein